MRRKEKVEISMSKLTITNSDKNASKKHLLRRRSDKYIIFPGSWIMRYCTYQIVPTYVVDKTNINELSYQNIN